jgi:hypothetical protein
VLRFGTAVGLAAAAALTCALPATMRISAAIDSEATARIWAGLAATALVPMVAMVVVLRGAREGLRAFAGEGAELRAYGVGLWAASLLFVLAFLGSLLRSTTHHHALAGVTFAFAAVVAAVASALASARVVSILRAAPPRPRSAAMLALALFATLALAWMGVRFVHAASRDAASVAAAGTVVDVLAFVLTALFAARRSLASRRGLALVGPPVAVAIAALGLSALHDPPLHAAIDDRAPAFAPVADEVLGP